MKARRILWKREYFIFAAACAVGVLFGIFRKNLPDAVRFENGYAHAFPVKFTAEAFYEAMLGQLLPLLIICFCGFCLIGDRICVLLLTFRCLIAGYLCAAVICIFGNGNKTVFILFFCFFEVLILPVYGAMSGLAKLFLAAARKGVGRKTVLKYLCDQLFFVGLGTALYLLRGTAVLLLVK